MVAATDGMADLRAWLQVLDMAGVTQLVADEPRPWATRDPVLRTSHAPATAATPTRTPRVGRSAPADPAVASARDLAAGCRDIEALIAAVEGFTLCPLARTATRACIADGDPSSPIMLIGEAPGAEEDRQGKPFVGASGRLLDRMLAAAGRPRSTTWITNTVFWRPPGNREPAAQELAMCLPFLERQIELIGPRVILFVGGIAARALLDQRDGVTKLRGRRFVYRLRDGREIPARVMFHPAYLLRRPQMKSLAWRDLLGAVALLDAEPATATPSREGA
ncbi:MAG: uracil-DNA glycosylase [Pseudomonadota bacterium]